MNGEHDSNERIDRIARAIHAEAVDRVPHHTLARLRPRNAAAPARRGWRPTPALGWSLATACAAVFVFAVGMHALVAPEGPQAPPPSPALAEAPAELPAFDPYDDPLIAFDEDPDLFVWLDSDAQPLAME
ncbi:MAG: anti-sigma factor [Gammaproteobacteria bacterium]|nr:anti-sigma factor [Gammaproteobacteria bacterium]